MLHWRGDAHKEERHGSREESADALPDVEAANREMDKFRRLKAEKESLRQSLQDYPVETQKPGDQPQREPGP
jgi:hypothetical protein